MGRPKQHDLAMAEALLDVAEGQLAEGGVNAVSVRGAAQATGTTTRAVYSTFGGLDGLLAALAVRGFENLGDRINAVKQTGQAAVDLVNMGQQAFRSFALEKPHLFRLTFERMPAGVIDEEAVSDAAHASARGLIDCVARGKQQGKFQAHATREIVFGFHAACQGLASCELAHQPPPVGSDFWPVMRGADMESIWQSTLTLLVMGYYDSVAV